MKTHAELGARLLSSGSSPVLQMAAVIAATHHERWDGSGYPKGLAGEAIPLVGRIVAVADVFDALTHDRPYKSAWPVERRVRGDRRGAGGQFDPRVVEAFLALRGGTRHAQRRRRRSTAGGRLDAPRRRARSVAIPRRRSDLLEHIDLHAPRAETGQRRRSRPRV